MPLRKETRGIIKQIVHQFPQCFPKIRIDRGAIRFVLSGASLMAPGLTSAGGRLPNAENQLKEGDVVLDSGTAAGRWMLDFTSSLDPNINIDILGIDIEPRLFPSVLPPRISFRVESLLNLPAETIHILARFVRHHIIAIGLGRLDPGFEFDSMGGSSIQELQRRLCIA